MSNWFSNLIVVLMIRNFRRKLYLTVFMVTEKNNYCCMIFISKSLSVSEKKTYNCTQ